MSPNPCLNSFYRLGDPVMDWRCRLLGSSSFRFRPFFADGPRGPGGWSAGTVFVACSSCSCSPSFSIRCGFEFCLGEVSDGPRVPGGQSAGAWRTVRVLPADGPLFGVATGGSISFYGQSAAQVGRSAVPVRTIRGTQPDGPRGLCGQSAPPGRTVRQS
jgi:hypothetical protein